MAESVYKFEDEVYYVGILGSKAAEQEQGGPLTVGTVASILEADRPFLRQPFDRNQKQYLKMASDGKSLKLIASTYMKDVEDAVRNKEYRPNTPARVAAKGETPSSDIPLFYTGQMLGALAVDRRKQ